MPSLKYPHESEKADYGQPNKKTPQEVGNGPNERRKVLLVHFYEFVDGGIVATNLSSSLSVQQLTVLRPANRHRFAQSLSDAT